MSFTDIKTKNQGFTIVELLIVVVVIAILAAITIVSYNGITARANTSAAQSLAANVIKKAELYAADESNSGYPLTGSALTNSSNSSKPYYMPSTSVNFTSGVAVPDNTNGKTYVRFLKCAATTQTNQSLIIASNISGVRITYYDFAAGTTKDIDTGITTSCPAVV